MFSLLLAMAAAQVPATIVVQSLADVPNTTVRYYDVSGKNVTAINRSIARQRPQAPGKKLAPASIDWTVNASFGQRTVDGQCKITGADAAFTATADLPRLVNEQAVERAVLERWRKYVAGLEASEVPALVFVYSRLDEVEKAILASNCDGARAAATAAVERLKQDAAAFEIERHKASRQTTRLFDNAQTAATGADKRICKNLLGTGSRLNTLRVCMAPREWAEMQESGQKYAREMQDRPRVNKPF